MPFSSNTDYLGPPKAMHGIDSGLNSPEMARATLALHVHALYIQKSIMILVSQFI